MKKLLLISGLLVTTFCAQGRSYIKDLQYVKDTVGWDLEGRHVRNSKGKLAKILNGFIETYNLTALTARCEKNKDAKINITDNDDRQIVMGCAILAHYILETISSTPKVGGEIPLETKKRLEKSWIKIMQQGDFSFQECKSSHIE